MQRTLKYDDPLAKDPILKYEGQGLLCLGKNPSHLCTYTPEHEWNTNKHLQLMFSLGDKEKNRDEEREKNTKIWYCLSHSHSVPSYKGNSSVLWVTVSQWNARWAEEICINKRKSLRGPLIQTELCKNLLELSLFNNCSNIYFVFIFSLKHFFFLTTGFVSLKALLCKWSLHILFISCDTGAGFFIFLKTSLSSM